MSAAAVEKFYQEIAELDLWVEAKRTEAIKEYGLTSEEDITGHVDAAQNDLEYLEGQDRQLEDLIEKARTLLAEGAPKEEPLARLASCDLWSEVCRREAKSEYSLTEESDILEHIESASVDREYLYAQDETLEGVIVSVRKKIGFEPELTMPDDEPKP